MNEATASGQAGWRWCSLCAALTFGNEACHAGGTHQTGASGVYTVPHGGSRDPVVDGGQQGWRWCSKCNVLCHGSAADACAKGGAHELGASGHYAVHHRTERVFIDAAVEGIGQYAGKLFFFRGGSYVRFDLATRRVDPGYPLPLDRWKLSGAFAAGVSAAVNGEQGFAGKAYFYRGPELTRYDWAGDRIDDGFPISLTMLGLTGPPQEEVDAAFNGRGAFAGKLYLFRGGRYVRYDWASGQLDPGFPAALKAWNLPDAFLPGVDAAVDGGAMFPGRTCFFRGATYVTYDWASGACSAPREIADDFPGVLELLCVAEGARQALAWNTVALPWLRKARDLAEAGVGQSSPVEAMRYAALSTHFHLDTDALRKTYLRTIVARYEADERLLFDLSGKVVYRTTAEALADGHAANHPAYASFAEPVRYQRSFVGIGPLCQAAMVMHEGFHATIANGAPDHAYEHDKATYAALSPEHAVENPSSYVSFAQHLFYGVDERYGASRATE